MRLSVTVRQQLIGCTSLELGSTDFFLMFEGLGGTSLLNANVFLRADPETMASRLWPKEIRDATLDKCMNLFPTLENTVTGKS